ncbi:MAG: glycerol kinase GlpK [Oscillibacter sp.]|nr:glycerol kinase GlpK [Oscillibacter sp.]
MKKFFLGLDQGTTGTTAILFDENWRLAARGYREIRQIYPQAGWVEHDATDIWDSVLYAVREAMREAGAEPQDIACIGIDHEGESVMMWDKLTGTPVYNTIVWQDRRTARYADAVAEKHGDLIRERTGLMVDSYFSALKLRWLLDNVPEAKSLLERDRLLAGTMDSWLVWKMTHGKLHITDASTASRTMLLNLREGNWDDDVLKVLDLDRKMLPTICDSAMLYGYTDPIDFCGINAPISGILVDQQAALIGQTCTTPGTVKTTYGTGCFMLMNTGETPVYSPNGILTTVAWQIKGVRSYALDGGIYISGAATQWLRDGLKIINTAAETELLALAAESNGGLYFVPSFTGLAAPYWDSYARGMMIGITAGTTREQVVRATLESTAYQVSDVLKVMEKDSKVPISVMRCDGGATANNFLMQFQSDILGIPLHVPEIIDTTALGAAYIAAIGIGEFHSPAELSGQWRLDRSFEPHMSADQRESLLEDWHRAVERCLKWSRE